MKQGHPPGCVLGDHAVWSPSIGKHVTLAVFIREGKYWIRPTISALAPHVEAAAKAARDGLMDSGPVESTRGVYRLLRAVAAIVQYVQKPDGKYALVIPRLSVPPESPGNGGFTETGI